ncbi:MAG: hypothetical protein EAZ15_03565 [Sphingobacteriales bacterium]|nr:MAG: hypothetical protein EAZ15_03565 [Sphingobacteriales bacterium]
MARSGGVTYRYEYQGAYAEKDPITGFNNFDLRMYDGRKGRWLSTDPNAQYYSPYEGMGNNPVSSVDPDGGETTDWYSDGKGAAIWVAGSAPTIELNGQTLTNIGTSYDHTLNGVTSHFEQNVRTQISFVDEGMLTFKVANFAFTLANAYWDKTAATFEAVGEVPKFVTKVSRGLSVVGAGLHCLMLMTTPQRMG